MRLRQVYDAVHEHLMQMNVDVLVVERVFSQNNVRTAMGTAQAAAVCMLAATQLNLPVHQHTPTEVKAAVTGSGRADKAQVAFMVGRILVSANCPSRSTQQMLWRWASVTCGGHARRWRWVDDRADPRPGRVSSADEVVVEVGGVGISVVVTRLEPGGRTAVPSRHASGGPRGQPDPLQLRRCGEAEIFPHGADRIGGRTAAGADHALDADRRSDPQCDRRRDVAALMTVSGWAARAHSGSSSTSRPPWRLDGCC